MTDRLTPTPAQTVGPFFSIGMTDVEQAAGIELCGTVYDGAGEPVADAVLECWSAGVNEPAQAFARKAVDAAGRYVLKVSPPPLGYVTVLIFARGLLRHLTTRAYVDADALAQIEDLDPDRRATLAAVPEGAGYRFDIRLQGPDETVFFADA